MNHEKSVHLKEGGNRYGRLLLMTGLSFITMYIFMYAMVDSFANALFNLNQVYMAALMTAPMVIIELSLMGAMYMNRKLNALILGAGTVAIIGAFGLIRNQTAITDKQFLRSMIPHHASAILMCKKSPAQDSAIRELCKNILVSQQAEIAQMQVLLRDSKK